MRDGEMKTQEGKQGGVEEMEGCGERGREMDERQRAGEQGPYVFEIQSTMCSLRTAENNI